MLGRKTFTRSELDRVRVLIGSQLEAYRDLARAAHATDVGDVQPALAEFEHLFFNTLALALDRPIVNRLRTVAGREGTALGELELICDSLLQNDGVVRAGTVAGHAPGSSIAGLEEGQHVRLTAEQFERLAAAVFAELEEKISDQPASAG